MWGPVTTKPPPGFAETTPGVAVPSPQVTVALKSETVPNGLASVNVATAPVKVTPAIALRGLAADVSGASRTFSSKGLVKGPSLLRKWMVPW